MTRLDHSTIALSGVLIADPAIDALYTDNAYSMDRDLEVHTVPFSLLTDIPGRGWGLDSTTLLTAAMSARMGDL
ncbi:hypothetical protein OH77DRAFT_331028 [Trametes cingulata]|nr:hypothetical protein OH77DRAFT_331028 [Trametes cingulata]